MPDTIRLTLDLPSDVAAALAASAAEARMSVEELVVAIVRQALAEDAEDLAAFEERADEPNLPFDEVVRRLDL